MRTLQMQPLDDLLDRAFQIYRSNARDFLGMAAFFHLPVAVLQWLVLWNSVTPANWLPVLLVPPLLGFPLGCFGNLYLIGPGPIILLGFSVLQYLLLLPPLVGWLTQRSAHAYLKQYRLALALRPWRPNSVMILIQSSFALILVNAFGLGILVVYSQPGLGTWWLRPPAWSIGRMTTDVALTLPLGCVILALYSCLCLAPQVALLEERSVWEAWARSCRLVGRAPVRVIGTVALLGVLTCLVTTLPAIAIRNMGLALNYGALARPGDILAAIVVQLGLIVALPLHVTALTTLYYDLRIHTEGYDLKLQLEAQIAQLRADE